MNRFMRPVILFDDANDRKLVRIQHLSQHLRLLCVLLALARASCMLAQLRPLVQEFSV